MQAELFPLDGSEEDGAELDPFYGAIFSEEKDPQTGKALYRYRLWRRWRSGPTLLWILLNPSTADHRVPDPTLTRLIDYTMRFGYDGLELGNVYGFRSSKPKYLKTASDPRGPLNLQHIEDMVASCAKVICGWGSLAKPEDTAPILEILKRHGKPPHCLAVTKKSGQPQHPLYLPKRLEPILWKPKETK